MSRFPNISEAASIAIHSLALVNQSKDILNVNQVAEITGSSRNHISKVMQNLVRHGYLSSGRGPKGGFVSRMNADKVTLLEIIELIEGKMSDYHCGIEDGKCPFENCVFGDLPNEFKAKFREYYSTKTINEIKIAEQFLKTE